MYIEIIFICLHIPILVFHINAAPFVCRHPAVTVLKFRFVPPRKSEILGVFGCAECGKWKN